MQHTIDQSNKTLRRWDADIGEHTVHLASSPGFPDWDTVDAAHWLIGQHAHVAGERVVVLPCGHGALGAWAARSGASAVAMYDTNCIAVDAARATQTANGLDPTAVVTGLPVQSTEGQECPEPALADVVLLTLPKGRWLARLYLLQAYLVLRPGGRLYLAGANSSGIKSVIADGETLFGPSTLLGYKGGQRLALYTRPASTELPTAFQQPGILPGTFYSYTATRGDSTLTIHSRPGVFAWQGLDAGTSMLLDAVAPSGAASVLDVGCGCGVVGLVLARALPDAQITLTDVDSLACDSARRTLAANGIDNPRVIQGDGLDAVAGEQFALIVSNPPFHSGKDVSYGMVTSLIGRAPDALLPGGRLVLVANRFLNYDRLMQAKLGNVTVLARTRQYHVLQSEKKVEQPARRRRRRPRRG